MHEMTLTGAQSEMYNMTCAFPLFVAGFGSGKSYTLIVCAIRDVLENPGANIGIYSPTYDLNKLNLIPRFIEIIELCEIPYSYSKSDHILTVLGYGDIIFRSMTNPERIVAYETFRAHCDELDTLQSNKANEVWQRIIARNRQVIRVNGKIQRNRVSAYSTPEGYNFTYDMWGNNPLPEYEYVKASTFSNPHLEDAYIRNMISTYPTQLVKAYINGEWTNLTTGTVYYAYNLDLNKSIQEYIPGEPVHIGLDFNVNDMCAVVGVIRDRSLHIIDTIFSVTDTPYMCDEIFEKYNKSHITIYPDASGRGTTSKSASVSDMSIMKSKRYRFTVKAPNKNPRIKDRIMCVNKALECCKVYVNETLCSEFSKTLAQHGYNESTGQPIKDGYFDNRNDGFGYMIMNLFPLISRNIAVESVGGF